MYIPGKTYEIYRRTVGQTIIQVRTGICGRRGKAISPDWPVLESEWGWPAADGALIREVQRMVGWNCGSVLAYVGSAVFTFSVLRRPGAPDQDHAA